MLELSWSISSYEPRQHPQLFGTSSSRCAAHSRRSGCHSVVNRVGERVQRWRPSWPLSPSGRRCWPPRRAFGVRSSSCRCPGAAARGPCRSTSTLRLRRSCCCCRSSGVSGAMQQVCAGAADRGVCSCGAHDDRRQLDPDAVMHGWSNFLLHHVAAARSRCGCSSLAFLFARWARC